MSLLFQTLMENPSLLKECLSTSKDTNKELLTFQSLPPSSESLTATSPTDRALSEEPLVKELQGWSFEIPLVYIVLIFSTWYNNYY